MLFNLFQDAIKVAMILFFIPQIIGLFLTKKKQITLTSKTIKIAIVLAIIISALILNYTSDYKKYKIDGSRVYGIEMYVKTLGDIISRDTIDIKSNKVKLEIEQEYVGGRYGSGHMITYYYLNINDGEYVIPIEREDKVEALLYNNTYGERTINTITVYKNSKFVKAVNGIDISEDATQINEFIKNKGYKINIKLGEDKTIYYETEGCTLDEFINNEIVFLCVFNENEKMVYNTDIENNTKLPVNLADGIYTVAVCGRSWKPISNTITYKVKDRVIYEIGV